ncbi:MAG: T9SS type A sorting domain-containing protein [Bacteroidales bacterium]|nr:T9SS type A sorting domain-containing protein [Bacteroidales bacterium]
MRKSTILLTVLIVLSIKANAQIPNSGFENWTTIGGYQDPQGWGSTNQYSMGPFYAITKSTDHYPAAFGSFSVRIENNITLNPNYSAGGAVFTGPPPPSPDFPVTGHPASLTGYYKYAPLGGDTMLVQVLLFKNGLSVSYGAFTTVASASSWTPFTVTFENYTDVDSASISIGAYYVGGFNYMPHGNSVLYVDNLNFDTFIGSVNEKTGKNNLFILYPNPASDVVKLNINEFVNEDLSLNIYNISGALVKSETLKQNQREINIGDLPNGFYQVEIKSKKFIEKQKLVILR